MLFLVIGLTMLLFLPVMMFLLKTANPGLFEEIMLFFTIIHTVMALCFTFVGIIRALNGEFL